MSEETKGIELLNEAGITPDMIGNWLEESVVGSVTSIFFMILILMVFLYLFRNTKGIKYFLRKQARFKRSKKGAEEVAQRSKYRSIPILSKTEFDVFRSIKEILKNEGFKGGIAPCVNLDSFIKPVNSELGATKAISFKGVDILIYDENRIPLLAIDFYKGYLRGIGGELKRADEAKVVALKKAKIEYLEIQKENIPLDKIIRAIEKPR